MKGQPKRRPRASAASLPTLPPTAQVTPIEDEPTTKAKVTAATHRPKVPTGTVAEVVDLLPPVPELEADDLDIREYHEQFVFEHVEAASSFIDRSGIAAFMRDHHVASKEKRGRKEQIPFRALLVALWLVATTSGNLWMTNLRDVLFHKMSPEARAHLGIIYPLPAHSPPRPSPQRKDRRG